MRDSIRIALVGDAQVGKTSIIDVLITEKFRPNVEPVLPTLVVPKEVTPENVHVTIVDTPGALDQVERVDAELEIADVVILVYAVDDLETTARISSYWLPKFRAAHLKIPIILVGNKIDTRGGVADPQAAAKMEAFIKPIMDRFREVDVCIECSAKTISNISEVFYFAQKAVLYPTGKVYDVETHQLRPLAVKALRRIFQICDKDADGGLNDKELNEFQFNCFNVHLQPDELDGVKKVVKDNRPKDGLNGDGSLSVHGFVYLHTLFVQKGRLETTYIVLRKFGYDENMRLSLQPNWLPKISADSHVELNETAIAFLGDVFDKADTDKDGLISTMELKEIFANSPEPAFGTTAEVGLRETETPKKSMMSKDGFIARWHLLFNDSIEDALLNFMYIGYDKDVPSLYKMNRLRRRDRNSRPANRKVFKVAVFGSNSFANNDIVRGLVNLPSTMPKGDDMMAASWISDGSSDERSLLIMHSINVEREAELLADGPAMDAYDVACVVFDAKSHDSFGRAIEYWQQLQRDRPFMKVPVAFVAAFIPGTPLGMNDVLTMADEFCLVEKLPTPTRVSLVDGDFASLFSDLLGVALMPEVGCPGYYDSAVSSGSSRASSALKMTVGVVATGAVIYGAKQLYDYYTSKPSASS